MKTMWKLLFISVVLTSIVLSGCGGGSNAGGTRGSTTTTSTLVSITVSPASASVAAGDSQQFTATGNFSGGTTRDLTSSATWSSSDTTVVGIGSTGIATGLKAGPVTITATFSGVSGTATLNVTAPSRTALTQITVVPNTASMAKGQTQQLAAFATFTDGSSQDVTKDATWSSSAAGTAAVSASGIVTGVSTGQATISAAFGGVTGSASLTVSAAVLQFIDITPDAPTIPAGGKVQFTATGTFSDGTSQDLTDVTWRSSDTGVASIGSDGVANGIAGSATPVTITSTVGSISDTTGLTVTAASLVSVAVAPENVSIAKGTTLQYTATGTFTDGSTQDAAVTWNSLDATVAGIDAVGLASGLKQGSTTITASANHVPDASTGLNVTQAVVREITVTPALGSIGIGGTAQFTATALFSDSTTQDVTTFVTWTSSAAAVATVSNVGVATSFSSGVATITATYEGVSGASVLTVTPARLQSIIINNIPNAAEAVSSLKMGERTRMLLYAWGSFTDGTTRRLASVGWSSTLGRVASISASGMVRSKKRTGTATVRATSGGVTGSLPMTVTTASIKSILVQPADASLPATPTIAAGTTIQLVAIAEYNDGTTQNVGSFAYWKTSDYASATVTNSGVARGVKAGSATISVTYDGVTGSTTLNVSGATLQSLSLTPETANIPLGNAQAFTATGHFADGSTQEVTTQVGWSSSDIGVAVVDRFGVAVSAGRGTATIGASFRKLDGEVVSGTATLNVN